MKLIGNTNNLIDWDTVIEQCNVETRHVLRYDENTFPKTNDFNELDSLWKQAGYKYLDPSIEWHNYFPKEHFSQDIVDVFETIVKAKPWMVWISKIKPGKMAPWHFDAHSKINELLNMGSPVRYTCYIQRPTVGHVSIVGDKCIYNCERGSIYQWPSYSEWHCGMNGGLTDKLMFNYWGYV